MNSPFIKPSFSHKEYLDWKESQPPSLFSKRIPRESVEALRKNFNKYLDELIIKELGINASR